MSLPEWDTLETAEAIHSFLERWALGFFAGVVLCDLLLHFLEESKKLVWCVGWWEHRLEINVHGHMLAVKWPAYHDTLAPRRLIKQLSWLGFAIAILLEIVALPYSERIDDLSKRELTSSQKQITASLQKSAEANERARKADESAGTANQKAEVLRRKNLVTESRLAEANQDIENEKGKRVELAASLLPREFFDQSGAITKLTQFPAMSAVFEFVNEREPKAMAEQINFVLKHLHWSTSRKVVNELPINEGISISMSAWGGHPPAPALLPSMSPEERLRLIEINAQLWAIYQQKRSTVQMAVQALRDSIKHCGIDAEIEADEPDLPLTTLLIKVGPKPNRMLETTLKELGPRNSTPIMLGSANRVMFLGGNRSPIPEQNADLGKQSPQ